MKNRDDTIRNWTRNLPACTAVPPPTAPSRTSTPHPPISCNFFLQGNLCRPSHGNKITASVMRKIPSQMYLFYVYSSMDFCFSRNTVNFNPCPRTHVAHSKVLKQTINPLNAQLNPICHLLALLGAHHILHVSKIWVKSHLPFASIIKSSPYSPR